MTTAQPPADPRIRGFADALARAIAHSIVRDLRTTTTGATPDDGGDPDTHIDGEVSS